MTPYTTYPDAQRTYDRELPPEAEEAPRELPDPGYCPWCRKDLAWDGINDSEASLPWCNTHGCQYDNGISEEENRRLWERQEELRKGL